MRMFIDWASVAYSVGGKRVSTFWHVPGRYNQFSEHRVFSYPLKNGTHTLGVQCWDSTPQTNVTVATVSFTVHRRPGDPKPPQEDRIVTTPDNLAVVCRQPTITVKVVGPSAPLVTHITLTVWKDPSGVKVFSGEGHTAVLKVKAPKPMAPGRYKITATVQDTYDVASYFFVR